MGKIVNGEEKKGGGNNNYNDGNSRLCQKRDFFFKPHNHEWLEQYLQVPWAVPRCEGKQCAHENKQMNITILPPVPTTHPPTPTTTSTCFVNIKANYLFEHT